jgi:hypothetical protein
MKKVEYEIEKPLLVRFDQIFDYDRAIMGKALTKVGYHTIINAIKGLDKRSREEILMSVPEWKEEKVFAEIEIIKEVSKKCNFSFSDRVKTKLARQRIVDAMISVNRKRKERRSGNGFDEVETDTD